MKIDTVSWLFRTAMPVFAPADENGTGTTGDEGGDGGSNTADATGETQTGTTVLGGTSEGDDTAPAGTTDDATGDDGKPADEAGGDDTDDTVPEDGVYDFGELPEGFELSDEDRKAWSSQFKEVGLTKAQARGLIEAQTARMKQDHDTFVETLQKTQNEHLETAKADPEIGGDKWEESTRLANLGLDTLGGEELKNLILTSGNGNNPEIIRELRRIGELVKDDTFDGGQTHAEPVSREQAWYGTTTPDSKKG